MRDVLKSTLETIKQNPSVVTEIIAEQEIRVKTACSKKKTIVLESKVSRQIFKIGNTFGDRSTLVTKYNMTYENLLTSRHLSNQNISIDMSKRDLISSARLKSQMYEEDKGWDDVDGDVSYMEDSTQQFHLQNKIHEDDIESNFNLTYIFNRNKYQP